MDSWVCCCRLAFSSFFSEQSVTPSSVGERESGEVGGHTNRNPCPPPSPPSPCTAVGTPTSPALSPPPSHWCWMPRYPALLLFAACLRVTACAPFPSSCHPLWAFCPEHRVIAGSGFAYYLLFLPPSLPLLLPTRDFTPLTSLLKNRTRRLHQSTQLH